MAIDKGGQCRIMTQFQDQALQEGFHIGVYEIKSILNASRFDITYRGWNHHLDAPVVLKEYFPHDFAMRRKNDHTVAPKSKCDRTIYESGLASFVEQAEILGQIEHRSIVRVHNTLQINGTAYLIMDYENGVPLSNRADPPDALTGPELKAILSALLAGLEQVHMHGTVHGDIHPSNILLRENGEPVLIDFAAAKLAISARSNKLAQELRAGYAALEQYQPGNRPDPQSDLYALGATMYRCITHNEPVPAPERISAINKSKPDMLGGILSSSSVHIDDENLLEAIGSMLRPEAEDRPRSAAEVLAALSDEQGSVQPMRTETRPENRKHADQPVESPRHAALWTGAVIAVAALIAGLWYFQAEEPASETLAFNKDSRPSPAASKRKEIGAERRSVPPTHAEEATAEAREPINTEPLPAKRQALDVGQESAETEKAPQQLATTTTAPSHQLPSTAEHAEMNAPKSHPERATGSDATVVPATKMDKVALAAIAASQSDTQSSPKPPNGDGTITIQSHLAAAEAAITALRLTTPPENNAYRHYQAVLALDPENAEAQAGVQRIVDMYVWLIEKAIAKRRFRRAALYLARAETVSPNAPKLRRVQSELHKTGE